MRTTLIAISLVGLAVLSPACEKDGSNIKIKPSGELSDTERKLLGHLPAGAQLVFGGSYQKFMEYWDNSPMKELVTAMTPGSGAMGEWMDCWTNAEGVDDIALAGSFQASDGVNRVRVLFQGLKKSMLEECAKKTTFGLKKDDDGKYLELSGIPDGRGGTSTMGYYFADDDTAFFAMDIPGLTPGAKPVPATRAQLEADIKKAAASPAVDSAGIKDLLKKANRSKPFWFSGSAEGTSLAAKVKEGHGWIDTSKDAITFRFSVELTDSADAKRAVEALDQARSQLKDAPAGMMPGGEQTKEIALSFIKGVRLSNNGATLAGEFKFTNDMLTKLIPLAGMMGAGMGAGM